MISALLLAASLAHAAPEPSLVRIDVEAPPSAAELDAARRLTERKCGRGWDWAWPGAARFCLGRPVEGAVLSGLAAAELTAGIALMPQGGGSLYEHGGPTLPWVGLQNLYATGIGLTAIESRRARWLPYTPTESLGELVRAPFDPQVLRHPGVWLGGGVLVAAATAITVLDTPIRFDPSVRPNVFGADLHPAVGYPVAAGADAFTFLHVAIGEEVLFRGVLQSDLTRATDPTVGWLLGSAVFGLFHVPNALALPEGERLSYLTFAIPWITLTGSWLGHVYRWSGYRLGPPVAIHFWYDFALVGAAFLADPQRNPLSAKITVPF